MVKGYGRRLENLRDKAGYSKLDMSRKLNFSDNVYGDYEREKTPPTLDTFAKLAAIFNVSIDYLYYGEEHQQEKFKSYEKLIRIFHESSITDPYIFEIAKWSVLNEFGLNYLQANFEWAVDQPKMRK